MKVQPLKPPQWAGSGQSRTALFPRSYEYCRAYAPDDTVRGAPLFYADYDYSNWLFAPTPDANYSFSISSSSFAAYHNPATTPTAPTTEATEPLTLFVTQPTAPTTEPTEPLTLPATEPTDPLTLPDTVPNMRPDTRPPHS